MSQQDNDNWTFSDWVIIAFMVLMVASVLSILLGGPAQVEPGFWER